ncbi:MAG: hypothetical protein JHC57_16160 [Sphingopyxis sp.]|uniref:DUF6151 family protein n=1 Tax=Sphingopyxis sp. TaxID=1908224 RepID=UPI001A34547D|nr:DUF6151 family protein [Sphingopyxis sp.]MBJ7501291.1 hypothetical protein [Sphingopyxis sp.]
MASDLSFACDCGTVTGAMRVVPGEGDHVVCHCTDCQNLTHHLGHAHLLDAHGGTPLYQTRCARMRIDSGRERLACLHLTDAPTLRWYAACCRTPLFNTFRNGKLPFITILTAACDPARRAEAFGQPRGHLFTQDAIGDAGHLPKMGTPTLMRRFFVRAIRDIVSGDRRRSALFDAKTLEPIATPHRLTGEERKTLNNIRTGADPTP